MKSLKAHIQLQAIIYQIQPETANEYLELNIARNTGLISSEEYVDTIWMINTAVAKTQQLWHNHKFFSKLVTTLVNEYYLSFIILD
jgi:hypothetical protein